MKTIEIKLYQFSELSPEAQEKALNNLREINVNFSWWESTYEDAKNVGLKLTSFDLDRNRHANGDLILSPFDCATKITQEHGKDCETYKTAKAFLENYWKAVSMHSDGINLTEIAEGKEDYFNSYVSDMQDEFKKSILEDYSIILQKECEYLQSDEAVKETIVANEYNFLEDGEAYM